MTKREIFWLDPAKKAFGSFPAKVQVDALDALSVIGSGGKPLSAKPMKALGSGILEIAIRHKSDAWRVVYALKLGENIWIIHAFQKKSKSGIATPKEEIETIRRRIRLLKERIS